jgi:hypothetical protein
VTMAATESVDAYNNLARVSSAYQAAGIEAAWSEADLIGREETQENKQRLLGMIPFVNTVRQGSQVIRTYEEEGSFAGGMQVGRTTFSLGVDATVVYGAASGARAVARSSRSSAVQGGAPAGVRSPRINVVPRLRRNSAGQLINEKGQFVSGAGGESATTAAGRAAHTQFDQLVMSKPGWQHRPRIVDPSGRLHMPDSLSRSGKPVELKPATSSGYRRGRRALKRYQRVSEKRGRVIYYDPVTGELLPFWSRRR